ncbi:hypothetical protein NKR23_g1917 [Pleurostoma richardsiae]|uniref:Uncharacterized protein n=1 Tax=Pleurostoma richardsiae TaxID=41990 RepID=A0AA38RR69_9PEZI|nr:hypothetical protein NKR23_g1917 [Pleurostoma richardsiae]
MSADPRSPNHNPRASRRPSLTRHETFVNTELSDSSIQDYEAPYDHPYPQDVGSYSPQDYHYQDAEDPPSSPSTASQHHTYLPQSQRESDIFDPASSYTSYRTGDTSIQSPPFSSSPRASAGGTSGYYAGRRVSLTGSTDRGELNTAGQAFEATDPEPSSPVLAMASPGVLHPMRRSRRRTLSGVGDRFQGAEMHAASHGGGEGANTGWDYRFQSVVEDEYEEEDDLVSPTLTSSSLAVDAHTMGIPGEYYPEGVDVAPPGQEGSAVRLAARRKRQKETAQFVKEQRKGHRPKGC